METVFFDESGNTGQNLLDLQDPIFALSSCRFSEAQTLELLQLFAWGSANELKFSKLRRSPRGRDSILRFLQTPAVNAETVATVVFHKQFMIVTKYCDTVLEPSMREFGIDFYRQGMNIATANLLAMVMPVHLNPVTWNNFLSGMVRAVREKTPHTFRDWRRQAEIIYAHLDCVEPEMAAFILPVLTMDTNGEDFYTAVGDDELDPLIPAYYVLVNHWGKQLHQRFDILADESKVLAKHAQMMLDLSTRDLRPRTAGYDRRTMEFPLKVNSILPVDSQQERQVQFADLLAGACCAACRSDDRLVAGSFENELLTLLLEKRLIIDCVWPGNEIEPEALGTDQIPEPGEPDLPEHTCRVLSESLKMKKNMQS